MFRKNLVVRKNFVPLHPQLSNKGVADTGCSAVGSVPGLGPGCRRFESCYPDEGGVSKRRILFFYKQSPDFHKPGLCHVQKILYL